MDSTNILVPVSFQTSQRVYPSLRTEVQPKPRLRTWIFFRGSTHSGCLEPAWNDGYAICVHKLSDSGAASHTISVSTSATYTATFQTQYRLTTAVTPAAGGTVLPLSPKFQRRNR